MKVETIVLPTAEKILKTVGWKIRLARKRRHRTMQDTAERAYISRQTLSFIEKGSPKVAIGKYISVLLSMSLEKDFLAIAGNDSFGRKLRDKDLTKKSSGKIKRLSPEDKILLNKIEEEILNPNYVVKKSGRYYRIALDIENISDMNKAEEIFKKEFKEYGTSKIEQRKQLEFLRKYFEYKKSKTTHTT